MRDQGQGPGENLRRRLGRALPLRCRTRNLSNSGPQEGASGARHPTDPGPRVHAQRWGLRIESNESVGSQHSLNPRERTQSYACSNLAKDDLEVWHEREKGHHVRTRTAASNTSVFNPASCRATAAAKPQTPPPDDSYLKVLRRPRHCGCGFD